MRWDALIDYIASRWTLVVQLFFFFFQAEDGIRDLVRSRGLGDVYKRQPLRVINWKIRQSLTT